MKREVGETAAKPRKAVQTAESDLHRLVVNLLKEITQKELDDTSEDWVSVKRTKLKNLAALVGLPE